MKHTHMQTQQHTHTHCRAAFTKFTKNSCAGSQSITDRPLILSGTDNHTNACTLFYWFLVLSYPCTVTVTGKERCVFLKAVENLSFKIFFNFFFNLSCKKFHLWLKIQHRSFSEHLLCQQKEKCSSTCDEARVSRVLSLINEKSQWTD